MQKPKKVLCIMDMAGFGRSSMAVVLPVLSACGVQGCPLPTALFSTHFGGFGQVAQQDVVEYAMRAVQHYKRENIVFDAIYSGYLQGEDQFTLVKEIRRQYPEALFVCDPAMGDHGKCYSSITPEMVNEMKALAQDADVITPNYTESALLLGEEPTVVPLGPGEMQKRLLALSGNTQKSVVITSVPAGENCLQMDGYNQATNTLFSIPVKTVPQNYPGSGDLFAAALVGLSLQGIDFEQAILIAGKFVEASIQTTFLAKNDSREGVWFESQLYRLTGYVNNWNAVR